MPRADKQKDIIRRIKKNLGLTSLADKLANQLSTSDFNSLLTDIFSVRADNSTPNEVIKQYAQNQYAKPATWNAARYRGLEAEMLLIVDSAYGMENKIGSHSRTNRTTYQKRAFSQYIEAVRGSLHGIRTLCSIRAK